MDVNSVLSQLIINDTSFPALKLAWDCQIDVKAVGELPKVLTERITSSQYIEENQLTTEQRLALLCRQQRKVVCRKPGVDVIVEPAMIVFQNYKYGDTLSIPITIRNISKMSQKVTVLMDETFVFKFDNCSQRVYKFPCGMSMSSTINMHPEDDRDYYHKLVITTNKTRFAIPIIGIGGRGLLNAPDLIVFDKVSVKYFNTKIIPVCNIGSKPARFVLSTTGPFCVKPEKGIVSPRESFSLEVSYYSEVCQQVDGYLLIKYENGEEVYVYLKAEAINVNIKLCPTDAFCDDTYLGMKTKFICSIVNNSDIMVDFKWKKDAVSTISTGSAQELDDMDFQRGGEDALDRAIDLLENCGDGNDCLGFAIGLEEQMIGIREGSEHLYAHENFLIQPLIGQVQPHSSTDVYVIFSPQDPIVHRSIAYLDVTGIEERVPLNIFGNGLGPKFRFGFEIMDLGTVFLGGTHSYEIPTLNISEIAGKIEYIGILSGSSEMSMKVEPRCLDLLPDEHGAFYLSLICFGKPGDFQEDLKFLVPNTKDVVYITVKGSISFPNVHFTDHEANFGQVSYGFPKSYQVSLVNDSLNYVDIFLQIDEDGKDPPIDFNKILESFKSENFEFDKDPAEFTLDPIRFSLHPRGMQRIKLILCANQVREIKRKLICFVTETDGTPLEQIAKLPINATCIVPALRCENEEVYLTECYMQFPYHTEFLVRNSTDLSACYCLVPQINPQIKIQSDKLVGVARPRQVTAIPFEMTCLEVGESIMAYFDLYIVGREETVFTYTLKVDCIPPKLEPNVKLIDFGNVNVLIPVFQTVDIVNSSPLTVHYAASLTEGGGNGDTWEVDKEFSVIHPNSSVTIGVTVTLLEAGSHSAVLHVQMTEALAFIDIKMKAFGVGLSIKFSPFINLHDTIDFGAMFTKTPQSFQFELTNLGHLPKILDWKHINDIAPENPPPRVLAKDKFRGEKGDITKKGSHSSDHFMRKTPFTITPPKEILQPKTSITVTFTANSDVNTTAEEDIVLWTYTPMKNAEGDTMKHINMLSRRSLDMSELKEYHHSLKPVISRNIKLKAVFESPTLRFSKKSIFFRIDVTPQQDTVEQQETIKVENCGFLPIEVHFQTSFPFSLILTKQEDAVEEWTHIFQPKEEISLNIKFVAQHLRKDKGGVFFDSKLLATYVDHPGKETILLRGEVYFPTLNIDRNVIDFGTIVNGTEAVEEITLSNKGPFCLSYKWYIKPNSTAIQQVNEYEHGPVPEKWKSKMQPLFLHPSESDVKYDSALLPSEYNFYKDTYMSAIKSKGIPDQEMEDDPTDSVYSVPVAVGKKSTAERYRDSSSGKSLDDYGDSVQFLREKMYRSRLLEMIGIRDPPLETEDEVNYLSYNRDLSRKKSSVLINEIVDIIPMAGVISAGQSQTFTVVFYGHPDMTFKTTAFCFVEGGTGQSLEIKGASTRAIAAVLPKSIDLGTMLFSDVVSRKITVKNTGRVPMDVRITQTGGKESELVQHAGHLEIFPMVANIAPGGYTTFQVSYIPDSYNAEMATVLPPPPETTISTD